VGTVAEIGRANPAFGAPGIAPRWTHGDKSGLGTSHSAASRIWFTLWNGIVTEVYYPRVDLPQLRDLQLLLTDGATFFHEERKDLVASTTTLERDGLAYRITSRDPDGRYSLIKEVISDPHLPCVQVHVEIEASLELLEQLHAYVLCAPHLNCGGAGNNAYVVQVAGRKVLAAEKAGTWLALGADVPYSRASCGYVGTSDGWTDLADNYRMDWEFDYACNGNVALTGELALNGRTTFSIGLAFGDSLESAATALLESLSTRHSELREACLAPWRHRNAGLVRLEDVSDDEGRLYHRSYELLIAHEDKTFPGALIASMSIPWGESKGDEDRGGYHLVWTRDLVACASALLAAGDLDTPRRALVYLAVAQRPDGGFPQNFWVDGKSYWHGIQLDEVAFPILLAWRLKRAGALDGFDPYPMVMRAASYLVMEGPVTQQERWEEASGYSPSTLAATIAALICAAELARETDDAATADFLTDYADFLETHLERWTVTSQGELLAGVPRHYIRIHPIAIDDPTPDEDPDRGTLLIVNRPPGTQTLFPARNVVDAGFLQLVRLGVRRADDPVIADSVRVVDAVLRVETPAGPCWRRYNHDGYGQRDDGGPFEGWGRGRAWPLLAGERGHYEVALGQNPMPFVHAMERMASPTSLLPEQVWDEADRPASFLFRGKPTGSAMPLMWAHAEYIALLRSVADERVFDYVPAVGERYLFDRKHVRQIEVWKPNRQPATVARNARLRIQATRPFRLHWTDDEWDNVQDTDAGGTTLGVYFADLVPRQGQQAPFRFTFFWTGENRWEGKDYAVAIG
jgi:glucoamylase